MKFNKTANAIKIALMTSLFSTSAIAEEKQSEQEVETIVVTGQKIERTLQETKESVALISEDYIADTGMLDLDDAYFSMANVYTLSNGENFGIRGITQNASATGGGNGELGSFYMDGVAFTGFSTRFGPRDLWDVEQIEVLRGPQSTNVGRQALIGAVVVQTNDPSLSGFEAAVRAQYGNFNTRSLEGMVNFSVTENSALRVVAETYKSDGYIENVTLGNDDYDPDDNKLVRVKYLYQPSDDLSVLFSLQHADKEMGWDGYRRDLQAIDSYKTSSNLVSFETYEGNSASLDIDYQLNEQLSVRSVTSIIDGKYNRFNDNDSGPEGGDNFRGRNAKDNNWAQEIRFTYESEKLNGVFGFYYTDVEVENNTLGIVTIAPAQLGVPAPLLPFYPELLIANVNTPSTTNTKNMAFFTEWDYNLSDDLILSADFRYDREEQESLTNTRNSLDENSILPDPTFSGQVASQMGLDDATVAMIVGGITQVNTGIQAQVTPSNNDAQESDFNAFLPQLGLTYLVNDDVSVSAFYKRGYRAGGIDVDMVGTADSYDAEYLDNFELALRSVHLDGDLVINANAYYGNWKDQQLTIYVNGSLFDTDTINAGKSKIYGTELEVTYKLSADTTVYSSFGYAKTEFDEFCFVDGTEEEDITGAKCDGGDGLVGQDLKGNDFAYSPDLTFAIGGRHYFTDNLYTTANITYQGSAYSDVVNTAEFENDGFTRVNLSAGYILDDLELTVYIRNAFDEFYSNYLGSETAGIDTPDREFVNPGVPREFGITAAYQF